MKKDLLLKGLILQSIASKFKYGNVLDVQVEGYTQDEVAEQIYIMGEQGLFKVSDASSKSWRKYLIEEVTEKGEAVLEEVRQY
jgi:hypothetical protein